MIRRGATSGRAPRRQQRSPRQAWRRACGGGGRACRWRGGERDGEEKARGIGGRTDGPATQLAAPALQRRNAQAKATESSKFNTNQIIYSTYMGIAACPAHVACHLLLQFV